MINRSRAAVLSLGIAAVFGACAPQAFVVVSRYYDPTRIKRIALVDFTDFPGEVGSGGIAAATLDKYLLSAGYRLVERREAEQLLRAQGLDLSGDVSPDVLRTAGRVLGVDAIALGAVTDFTGPRDQTVMIDMPQEQTDPVYAQVVTTQHSGGTRVETTQNIVTGYASSRSSQIVPQTQTVPAHVGLAIRLVDVRSGEVLWSASSSSSGADVADATERSSLAAMSVLIHKLKDSLKPPRKE